MTKIVLPRLTQRMRRRLDADSAVLVGHAARVLEPVLTRAAATRRGGLSKLGLKSTHRLPRADPPPGRVARVASGGVIGIVFVDIAGFTGYTARRGDAAAVDLLALAEALVDEGVTLGRGEKVKRLGDGFLLAFPSASQAVRAGTNISARAERLRDLDASSPLTLRIAIHVGRPTVADDDLVGHDVNLTFRLLDHCAPGEVVLSAAAKESAERRLRTVVFDAPRTVELRGAPTPAEIFRARGKASRPSGDRTVNSAATLPRGVTGGQKTSRPSSTRIAGKGGSTHGG